MLCIHANIIHSFVQRFRLYGLYHLLANWQASTNYVVHDWPKDRDQKLKLISECQISNDSRSILNTVLKLKFCKNGLMMWYPFILSSLLKLSLTKNLSQYVVKSFLIWVQFPMSPTKRKSIPVTTYFITLIGRPHCNGHFCWRRALV